MIKSNSIPMMVILNVLSIIFILIQHITYHYYQKAQILIYLCSKYWNDYSIFSQKSPSSSCFSKNLRINPGSRYQTQTRIHLNDDDVVSTSIESDDDDDNCDTSIKGFLPNTRDRIIYHSNNGDVGSNRNISNDNSNENECYLFKFEKYLFPDINANIIGNDDDNEANYYVNYRNNLISYEFGINQNIYHIMRKYYPNYIHGLPQNTPCNQQRKYPPKYYHYHHHTNYTYLSNTSIKLTEYNEKNHEYIQRKHYIAQRQTNFNMYYYPIINLTSLPKSLHHHHHHYYPYLYHQSYPYYYNYLSNTNITTNNTTNSCTIVNDAVPNTTVIADINNNNNNNNINSASIIFNEIPYQNKINNTTSASATGITVNAAGTTVNAAGTTTYARPRISRRGSKHRLMFKPTELSIIFENLAY